MSLVWGIVSITIVSKFIIISILELGLKFLNSPSP